MRVILVQRASWPPLDQCFFCKLLLNCASQDTKIGSWLHLLNCYAQAPLAASSPPWHKRGHHHDMAMPNFVVQYPRRRRGVWNRHRQCKAEECRSHKLLFPEIVELPLIFKKPFVYIALLSFRWCVPSRCGPCWSSSAGKLNARRSLILAE